MIFKKVTKALDLGVYLGITKDGEKVSFEVCDTKVGRRIFVDCMMFKDVTEAIAHYAPFPEIEYEN